jgi:hypothetical protein
MKKGGQNKGVINKSNKSGKFDQSTLYVDKEVP